MADSNGIPALTPEETAMVRRAEKAKDMSAAFVLHYLHWSNARAEMLDAAIKLGQQLTLVKEQINEAGRPGMHLPMGKLLESENGGKE